MSEIIRSQLITLAKTNRILVYQHGKEFHAIPRYRLVGIKQEIPQHRFFLADLWATNEHNKEAESNVINCLFAHELGHIFDYQNRKWAYYPPYFYVTWMSRMDIEMQAWDFALRILKFLDFTNWNLFEDIRCYALNSHFQEKAESE